jgi:hypothetical protein
MLSLKTNSAYRALVTMEGAIEAAAKSFAAFLDVVSLAFSFSHVPFRCNPFVFTLGANFLSTHYRVPDMQHPRAA